MRTGSSIRMWLWVQFAATLVLLFSVTALAYYALRTHDALCGFKADIERREVATREFREGIERGTRPSIPGISVNDLARSESNFRQTIESLSDLDCS